MRGFARFLNIIIAVICAFAIFGYVTKPFIDISLKFKVTGELLGSILSPEGETSGEGNGGSENPLGELDFSSFEDVDIELNIAIPAKAVLGSFTSKETDKYVQTEIIDSNVDLIMTKLEPAINSLADSAVKTVAKSVVTSSIKSAITENIAGKDDNAAMQAINEHFSDEKIDETINTIFDSLAIENQTVDGFTETICEEINSMIGELSAIEGFEELAGNEIQVDDLKDTINDVLSTIGLVDENGNIQNGDNLGTAVLSMLLGQLGGSQETPTDVNQEEYVELLDEEPSQEDPTAQIKDTLKSFIYEKIDANTINTIVLVLKICAGCLFFFIFIWGLQILKIIFKMLTKSPAIKLGGAIWLGAPLQIILGYIPALFFLVIEKGWIPQINDIVNGIEIFDKLGGFNNISLSITTSGFWASLGILALIIISIPNSIVRRKIKKDNRSRAN